MMSHSILYEVKNRRAYITLNRPEKRNALNQEMVAELLDKFQEAKKDSQVKVVILSGNGPAFCAGADLAYLERLQQFSFDDNLKDSESLKKLFAEIYAFPKPVIARVAGHAIAGGCGLATVCDFVYSSSEVKYGYTEVRIGFVPALVLVFLIRKIGEARASDLLLSGRLIKAEEAQTMGLIHYVTDPDKLDHEVENLAEQLIESNSAESMKLTKKLIKNMQDLSLGEGLSLAARTNAESRMTADWKKGISAFLEKKPIKW